MNFFKIIVNFLFRLWYNNHCLFVFRLLFFQQNPKLIALSIVCDEGILYLEKLDCLVCDQKHDVFQKTSENCYEFQEGITETSLRNRDSPVSRPDLDSAYLKTLWNNFYFGKIIVGFELFGSYFELSSPVEEGTAGNNV